MNMPFYPIFIKPALGFVYRRRCDGVLAAVMTYAKFPGVHLVDQGGGQHWETRETFWQRWVHTDLYSPEGN